MWPSALFLYCMFGHGTGELRQKSKEITKREKNKTKEFLEIFTPQIQALVYLWLEKPNIARVMHSQSFCVPYCISRVH